MEFSDYIHRLTVFKLFQRSTPQVILPRSLYVSFVLLAFLLHSTQHTKVNSQQLQG